MYAEILLLFLAFQLSLLFTVAFGYSVVFLLFRCSFEYFSRSAQLTKQTLLLRFCRAHQPALYCLLLGARCAI